MSRSRRARSPRGTWPAPALGPLMSYGSTAMSRWACCTGTGLAQQLRLHAGVRRWPKWSPERQLSHEPSPALSFKARVRNRPSPRQRRRTVQLASKQRFTLATSPKRNCGLVDSALRPRKRWNQHQEIVLRNDLETIQGFLSEQCRVGLSPES